MNHHLITERLNDVDDETLEVVLGALDHFVTSPMERSDVVDVQRMEGPHGRQDRWIAWLPRGWILTYRPHLNGPPPHAGRNIAVLDFRSVDDLANELM